MTAETPPTREGPRRGSLALLVHSWIGVKLSLVLLFVVLTGTVAVVSAELDWLLDARVRAEPGPREASLGEMLALVETQRPDYAVTAILLGPHANFDRFALPFAVAFDVRTPAGAERVLYVDPYQRRITGERSYFDLPFFLRQLHAYLFSYPYGFVLNGLLGVLVLGGLVTGLMSYQRFWRGFGRRPKRSQGPRVYWPALHRWLGLWSGAFIFLIGATMLWFLAQETLIWTERTEALGRESWLTETQVAARTPAAAQPRPLDELVARAQAALPGFEPRYVELPAWPRGTLMLWGQASASVVRDFANQVHLDPNTGEVLWVQDAARLSAPLRLAHAADRLHFGVFGGLATKVLWFAFGVSFATLIVAGSIVHVRRAALLTRAYLLGGPPAAKPGEARKLSWRLHWLEHWRWVNAAVIAVAAVGGYLSYSHARDSHEAVLWSETRSIGPWRAELRAARGAPRVLAVRFCDGCLAQLKLAHLTVKDESGRVLQRTLIEGYEHALEVPIEVEAAAMRKLDFELDVHDWAGTVHRADFGAGAAPVPGASAIQANPANWPHAATNAPIRTSRTGGAKR